MKTNSLVRFSRHLSDTLSIFLPKRCLACDERYTEQILCPYCLQDLYLTNFTSLEDNPLMRHFEGRISIQSAVSFLYFGKNSLEQQLLHKLKYGGYRKLGTFFADYMCGLYDVSLWNSVIDLIIPIPLDRMRLRHRGYNQTEAFAKRLAYHLHVAYDDTLLKKSKGIKSQVTKKKWDRWNLDSNTFHINDKASLGEDVHILLVDDLTTTGNTLQEAYGALSTLGKIKISIATIFMARG